MKRIAALIFSGFFLLPMQNIYPMKRLERIGDPLINKALNNARNKCKELGITITKACDNKINIFECPLQRCILSFYSVANLETHLQYHQSQGDYNFNLPNFICNIGNCRQKCSSQKALNIHKNHHVSIGNNLCEICGSLFNTKEYVKRHIVYAHRQTNKGLPYEVLLTDVKGPCTIPTKETNDSFAMDEETFNQINPHVGYINNITLEIIRFSDKNEKN